MDASLREEDELCILRMGIKNYMVIVEPTGARDGVKNVIFQTIPRLLDIDGAAAYLGLSPKTLRNRLGRKAENPFPVKPKRHGRKIVFDVRDLDKFADSLPYEDYATNG